MENKKKEITNLSLFLGMGLFASLLFNVGQFAFNEDNYERMEFYKNYMYKSYRNNCTFDLGKRIELERLRFAIHYTYMTGIKAFPETGQQIIISAMNNDSTAFEVALKKHDLEQMEVRRLLEEQEKIKAEAYKYVKEKLRK